MEVRYSVEGEGGTFIRGLTEVTYDLQLLKVPDGSGKLKLTASCCASDSEPRRARPVASTESGAASGDQQMGAWDSICLAASSAKPGAAKHG